MPYHPNSAQAYAENMASGFIDDVQLIVYTEVYAHPNQTGREIWELPSLSGAGYQIDSVRNRFPELERAGILTRSGRRKDRYTNKTADTWVTNLYAAVAADFVAPPKKREFYGLKRVGRAGLFFEDKARAKAHSKRYPGAEFIRLREIT